ncbi:NAD(+)--rifampin ADP-ribosyltransferase [Curtobacterium flaccumfaciens]|uniref:NAD(+)--rifampin ADP-ribosyltransferase n=1 Tax=Curtobacterium flaccumfaciens TaxID=2035 RepID=UPI00217EEF6E|nr:NAD(+)--rifampin ADP-ribosyltransferase [Curtobacterium flaccumfaciens]MCS6558708.1 NAD(+)--rifampin ADP-ribosyltransferase [Curtobacterium flaccumfaciens]
MAAADETGPFWHGTVAALRPGEFLSPGFRSNYRPDVVMNHVYFTATRDGAGKRLTPEALRQWRERLVALPPEERGEIVN